MCLNVSSNDIGPLCGSCSGNGSVISVLTFTCSSDCSSPDYALYPATAALGIIYTIIYRKFFN